MSNRKLAILAAIAVIMVVWAVAQSFLANRRPSEATVPGYLIGGVDIDAIASIRVVARDETIRLIRRGTGFVVGNRSDYPAQTGEVNNLIAACLDLRPAELITESEANHADLGVTEDKARYVVTFFDQEATEITGFYLSDRDAETGNTYARVLNDPKVWRVKDDSFPYVRTLDFIDQELIRAERKDIQQVTVTGPAGAAYTLKRKAPDSDEILLEGMPAGKTLKGNDYKWVFEALTSLRFDDVKKADDEAVKDLPFDRTYVCRMQDSTVYTLRIARDEDDKYWLRAAAQFTQGRPPKGNVQNEEELQKRQAQLQGWQNAQQFSARHKDWVYEIPSYKAENLTKAIEDLLEDASPPEDAASQPAAEADAGEAAEATSGTENPGR
ncbi:MAG TPA: DUF4340 domain-containing protein [Phycisphaerales bacterium]|nr:DUF4340 domain-containing protein [Phycisphaerales bacterium]